MKKEWQKNVLFGIGILVVILMYKFLDKYSLIVFIKSKLPGDMAGLLAGIVLGEKELISKSWYEIFIKTGLVHVVVASGSNLSILSLIVVETLAWMIGRKRAIILGLLFVCWYVSLVGFEAPISRAVIILFIYYWGQILGRKFNIIRSIVLMLFVVVLVDLDMVLTVSFWMSLVAFVAVVSFGNFYKSKRNLLALFALNLWVNAWLWPIVSLIFGKINLLGIIVGPLVLFGVEYVYVLGLVAMISFGISSVFSGGVLMLTMPFLKYFLDFSRRMSRLNFGVWDIKINWFMVIGWYMILISFLLKRNRGND